MHLLRLIAALLLAAPFVSLRAEAGSSAAVGYNANAAESSLRGGGRRGNANARRRLQKCMDTEQFEQLCVGGLLSDPNGDEISSQVEFAMYMLQCDPVEDESDPGGLYVTCSDGSVITANTFYAMTLSLQFDFVSSVCDQLAAQQGRPRNDCMRSMDQNALDGDMFGFLLDDGNDPDRFVGQFCSTPSVFAGAADGGYINACPEPTPSPTTLTPEPTRIPLIPPRPPTPTPTPPTPPGMYPTTSPTFTASPTTVDGPGGGNGGASQSGRGFLNIMLISAGAGVFIILIASLVKLRHRNIKTVESGSFPPVRQSPTVEGFEESILSPIEEGIEVDEDGIVDDQWNIPNMIDISRDDSLGSSESSGERAEAIATAEGIENQTETDFQVLSDIHSDPSGEFSSQAEDSRDGSIVSGEIDGETGEVKIFGDDLNSQTEADVEMIGESRDDSSCELLSEAGGISRDSFDDAEAKDAVDHSGRDGSADDSVDITGEV